MLLLVDLLKPSILFPSEVQIWAPSTWNLNVKLDFPSKLKSSTFELLDFVLAHQGLVQIFHLVVEGQFPTSDK